MSESSAQPSRPASSDSARRLVELNHIVTAGMITYPGLPGPEITAHLTREASRAVYDEGTEFSIDRISMLGNTGTYLDSPFHRYDGGTDLAGLALEAVADLPTLVVELTAAADPGIEPDVLEGLDPAGCAVLLHTGWDRHWGTPEYGRRAPYLSGPAAQLLADRGARLVGIDSVNIDSTKGGQRPAHSILLAAGIPVLEHLTGLAGLPGSGARLHAAPVRVRDFGTFPVRAYAVVPGPS
ncbi:MAG: cyclase family protein [Mycobacteriales bacterium]